MKDFKSDLDLRPICGNKRRLVSGGLTQIRLTAAWTPKKTLPPGIEIQPMEISEATWWRRTTEILTLGKLHRSWADGGRKFWRVSDLDILDISTQDRTLYPGDQGRHFLLISRLRFFQSKPRCTLDKLCNASSSPECPTAVHWSGWIRKHNYKIIGDIGMISDNFCM